MAFEIIKSLKDNKPGERALMSLIYFPVILVDCVFSVVDLIFRTNISKSHLQVVDGDRYGIISLVGSWLPILVAGHTGLENKQGFENEPGFAANWGIVDMYNTNMATLNAECHAYITSKKALCDDLTKQRPQHAKALADIKLAMDYIDLNSITNPLKGYNESIAIPKAKEGINAKIKSIIKASGLTDGIIENILLDGKLPTAEASETTNFSETNNTYWVDFTAKKTLLTKSGTITASI